MAYVWLQHRELAKDAKAQGINVKAGILSGSARVFGLRGAKAGDKLPENVKVRAGLASGNAEVSGVVYGDAGSAVPQSTSLEVLGDIFKQLNKSSQIKLISSAQNLLNKQEKTSA